MAVADAGSQPGANWDEAQLTSKLAHLERLQAQLNELRLTIPRVVTPFYSPPTASLFREFKSGLLASQADIKSFRNIYQGQETQAIFEHARQRARKNSDLSKSGEVQRFGWIEREERVRKEAKDRNGADTAEESHAALTNVEVEKIVREWRARNLKLGFDEKDGYRDLTITFVSSSNKLNFHVVVSRDANELHKLHAECLGTTDVELAITRCVASRPNANDLKYLLDMIAAYKTVKSTACAKCGKLYDAESIRPMARRGRRVDGTDEKAEMVWEALHESCLD